MELSDLSPLQVVFLALALCIILVCGVVVILLAYAPPGTLQAALPVLLFVPPTVAALFTAARLGSVQRRARVEHEALKTEIDNKDRRLQQAEERLEALETRRQP